MKLIQLLSTITKRIANICGMVSGCLVVAMALLILYEVFTRYVLSRSAMIADEFGSYLLLMLSFLAVAYTWEEKRHIRITLLLGLLPKRAEAWLRLITLTVAFGVSITLLSASVVFLGFSFQRKMLSCTLWRFPLQGPQSFIVGGFSFLALVILLELVRHILEMRAGRIIVEEKFGGEG